ncbi:MAG: lipid A phosphoethanolamine transferase [Prevotella sp.]|jgi:glucan phosphoethanolaminetransferase (alkaline phosphatase superfamily)|nr:lipid A phosphoethanolamine transferase [Prevotella sp.]
MSKLKEYIKLCGKFVYKYKFTILVLVYIGLIAFLPIKMAASFPMAFHVISFFFLLYILAKAKYTFIFTFILAFILTFNAYFAFALGSDISMDIMASIFETHMAEAVSMLKGGVLIGSLVALILTTLILYLSEKELKDVKLSIKWPVIGLLVYLLLFLPFISYKRIVYEYEENLFIEFPIRVGQDKVNMYAPILYGNIATIIAYQEEMAQLRKFSESDKKLPDGIVHNDTIQTPEKIYLIIGESAYRKHLSLYGYPVKTTPFLDSLTQITPSPIDYYNGIAPAAFTRNVLRIALSFASPTDIQPFYEEKTLINLAHDAGYETYWISNQGASGIQDSYLGYLAAGTDKAVFTQGGYLANDDFNLIPLLKEEHKPNKKQFFVIHLVGSHNNYSDRYDKTDAEAIPDSGSSLQTDYDRSIHHTDRVLHAIYDIMQQDSTAVFFHFSDHGEILGKGHGPWKNGIAQFEIPLITIQKNAEKISSVMEKYLDTDTKLINNSSTIYILAEMMGYTIPEKMIEKSILEGRYVRHSDQTYSPFSEVKEKPEER